MTDTNGYRLPDPRDGDPWAGFEWDLPATYNVAAACLDGPPAADPALRHTGVDGDRLTVTYGALRTATARLAGGLAARGIGPGDRVGVCLPQSPECLLAHLAVYRRGAVCVPLSLLLGDAAVVETAERAALDALVVDRGRWDDLDREFSGVDVEPVAVGGFADGPLGGLSSLAADPVPRVETAPDDEALVLFTSGSSGRPAGVRQSHAYLPGSLPGFHCWFHLFGPAAARGARVWTPAEWAWAGALFDVVFPTLATEGTVVSRERRSGFDPATALAHVEREGVTHAFFPPTALARIREADVDPADWDLSALSVVMAGGERLPPAVRTWAEDALGVAVEEGYGQTEANALAGGCRPAFPPREGAMGKAYPGHDLVVVDEAGEELPDGTAGELAVRRPDPAVMLGYLDDPEATGEAFAHDGLLLTGDVVVRDADGYLHHRGRVDDLVVTSGYRVSPYEVEGVLEAASEVRRAVVGGVPDETRGQRLVAYVVLAEGVDPTAETRERLSDRVADELGRYKRPREVRFVASVPETRTGKADRDALFAGDDSPN